MPIHIKICNIKSIFIPYTHNEQYMRERDIYIEFFVYFWSKHKQFLLIFIFFGEASHKERKQIFLVIPKSSKAKYKFLFSEKNNKLTRFRYIRQFSWTWALGVASI